MHKINRSYYEIHKKRNTDDELDSNPNPYPDPKAPNHCTGEGNEARKGRSTRTIHRSTKVLIVHRRHDELNMKSSLCSLRDNRSRGSLTR